MKKVAGKKSLVVNRNQLGILAEDINSKFGLMLEGQSILVKQMKEVKEEVKEVKRDLGNQIRDFSDETNSKFETVFNYLSAMEP